MQETSVSGKGSVPSSNASPQEARQRHGRRAAENVQRALLTDIAPLLPGRSDDSVRNRWKRLKEEADAADERVRPRAPGRAPRCDAPRRDARAAL